MKKLFEGSEGRVASLEEERARLETETKELERSISRSIHAQGSSTSVHRQVSALRSYAVKSYIE